MIIRLIALIICFILAACVAPPDSSASAKSDAEPANALAKVDSVTETGYSNLKNEIELFGYFVSHLRPAFGAGFYLNTEAEQPSIETRYVSGETVVHVLVDSIGVKDIPVMDDDFNLTDETRPYLVLKGHTPDGNCYTTAVPVIDKENFMVAVADLPEIEVQQMEPGGGGGCNYSHSCVGSPCMDCSLTVSSNGCRGRCSCCWSCGPNGGQGWCNHSVSN